MFSRAESKQQNYLMIMDTIGSQEPGLISPKFPTKESVNVFTKKTSMFSINRVLSLPEETRDVELGKITNFITVNGYKVLLLNMLDAVVGSSIQDETELNIWLKGLATNSFLFGGKPDLIVEMYRKQPVLIALRLMELITIDKKA